MLTVLFVSHAQDHLWGSVVSGHHIGGHHEAGACGPSQTKVQDLQGAVWLHHYIAWFEILKMGIDWFEKLCIHRSFTNLIFIDRFELLLLFDLFIM